MLKKTTKKKSKTACHSVFVRVFSPRNDKVLCALIVLGAAELAAVRQSDYSAVKEVRVPKHIRTQYFAGSLPSALLCCHPGTDAIKLSLSTAIALNCCVSGFDSSVIALKVFETSASVEWKKKSPAYTKTGKHPLLF